MPSHIVDVTIAHIRPRIWRRLRVPSGLELPLFHNMLQIAFGWQDRHLHEFRVGDECYGPFEEDDDTETLDESELIVANALPYNGSTMTYVYDLSDRWIHNVTVNHIEPTIPSRRNRRVRAERYPQALACLAGRRAAPLEDCGGPSGYAELLDAMKSSDHPRRSELLEWAGGSFDPEAIDLDRINWGLASLV